MVQQAITNTAPARVIRWSPGLYIADRNNNLGEDISQEVQTGNVIMDTDLDVSKMTFQATLKTKRAVGVLTDFVAPFLRLQYEDGTTEEEQVGLYLLVPSPAEHWPGTSTEAGTRGGSFTELDGRDLNWLLAADMSTATINLAISANLITSAVAELTGGGISRYMIPPSSSTSAKALSWPPGTSRLDRINDLLNAANYYTLWFDRHGIANSKPYQDLADAEPAAYYTSSSGTVVPPLQDEPDPTELCNRVVVIGSDPAQAPLYAIRENNDITNGVSFASLGYWITRTEENSELQTQAAIDAYAEELLRHGVSHGRTLTMQTRPDPTRNPHEVYELDLVNGDGTAADGKWRCSGWELNLDPADPIMIHTLARTERFTVTIG